jgi:WD repeat-containing protein 61
MGAASTPPLALTARNSSNALLFLAAAMAAGALGPALARAPAQQYVSRSRQVDAHEDGIWCVAWSPNGQIVTGSCDELLHAFMAYGNAIERKHTLKGHILGIAAVAVSASGSLAASSALDSYIRLWDLDKGSERLAIDAGPLGAWGVALSPDGEAVAAGSQSGAVNLWSSSTGEKLGSLETGGKLALCVAFSPDGRSLACGSEDGIVYVSRAALAPSVAPRRCGIPPTPILLAEPSRAFASSRFTTLPSICRCLTFRRSVSRRSWPVTRRPCGASPSLAMGRCCAPERRTRGPCSGR